jgi:drug/metabolite transporter (DMT)-like permease
MAFQEGFSLNQMLFWRFALALPVMVFLVSKTAKKPSSVSKLLQMIALGAIGMGSVATFYFLTLKHFGAALAGIFLYLYPSFVAFICHFFLKQKLGWKRWACVAIALLGCAFTSGIGNTSSTGGITHSPLTDPLGLFFGVCSGASYALYILASAKLIKDEEPMWVSFGTIFGCFLIFGIFSLFEINQGSAFQVPVHLHAWIAILGLAWIASVLPFTTLIQGMKRIGAMLTSMFSTLDMVFGIILAALFLGENLTVLQVFGAVLVLLSVLLTSLIQRQ